jgi:hypothetical protein
LLTLEHSIVHDAKGLDHHLISEPGRHDITIACRVLAANKRNVSIENTGLLS